MKMKIELNKEEINVVLGALNEMPHRVVHELIGNIVKQVQNEMNKEAENENNN